MKVVILSLCLAVSALAAPPVSKSQPQIALTMIDLAAISRMTPAELELLAEGLAFDEMSRKKRSNKNEIQSKLGSAISSKIGLLGQASSGIASFAASASSGSSKGDEHGGYSYGPPAEEESSKYDFWGLKKSILNTLFQAVKAITGGVTILKGQLIKGGGALAAAAGKVISVKGEAVTNIGKKIVNSASLSPPKKHHAKPVYGPPPQVPLYGPPAHEYHHVETAPGSYGLHSAPSAPGYSKYTSQYEGRSKPLSGLHAGLILLKPLDGDLDGHSAPTDHGHTHIEPPTNLLSNAFQSIKSVIHKANPFATFAQASSEVHYPEESYDHAPAPAAYGPPHSSHVPSPAAYMPLQESHGPPPADVHATYEAQPSAQAFYGPPPSTHSAQNAAHQPPAFETMNLQSHFNPPDEFNSLQQPPPPPPPKIPPTSHDMTALNSYGHPAAPDSYYPPYPHDTFTSRNAVPPFDIHTDYGTNKYSPIAESVRSRLSKPKYKRHNKRLTPERLSKINAKLNKLNAHLQSLPRSSNEIPVFEAPKHFNMVIKKRTQNVSDIDAEAKVDLNTHTAIDLNVKPENNVTVVINETEPTPKQKESQEDSKEPEASEAKPVKYVLKGNKIVPVYASD